MARQRSGFAGDAFHQVSIARNDVSGVVDGVGVRDGCSASTSLASAIAMPTALLKPCPSGPVVNIHTGRVAAWGIPRCPAPPLAELLDIFQ